MKTMKKIFAVLMAAVMVMSLGITAFAANGESSTGSSSSSGSSSSESGSGSSSEEETPATPEEETGTETSGGTIKIENATEGQTYTIYKVFDLTYSGTNVSYTYTKTGDSDSLLNALQNGYTDEEGNTVSSPFTLTASVNDSSVYVVTIKKDTDDETVTDFVKGIASKLTAVADETAKGDTVEFTGLDYGYYYVTSTLGTLITIDSTLSDVTIKDKNTAPINVKTVEEDSTTTYGTVNDADIGQTVNFKSTITACAGALNYVFHDKMDSGLTFGSVSKITVGETELKAYVAPEDGEEEPTDWEYKVTSGSEKENACTFEVVFNQDYLDKISEETTIVISYTGKLNENAVIGSTGNKNTSKLSYGDTNNTAYTTPSETLTYTWSFDLHKYAEGVEYLKDAKFVLYHSETVEGVKTEKYATFEVQSDGSYLFTGWKDSQDDATEIVTTDSGAITIKGLDADTYYLRETAAPNGYNLLGSEVEVKIEPDRETMSLDPVTAKVENKSGAEMPPTGGIGTTMFYVIGTIVIAGAAAALIITKKRANGSAK